MNPSVRAESRYLPASFLSWSALAVVAAHAITIGPLRHVRFEPFSSGMLQIAAALVTAIGSYRASLRSDSFARRFWFLTGMAFTAFTTAQCLDVLNEFWLRSQNANPSSLLLLFFFAVSPLIFTLFQWTPADTDPKRWVLAADALQLALLIGVAGFIYLRIYDSLSGVDLTIARLQMLHWRNVLLTGALVVRACNLRGEARRLFAIVGASFAAYTVGSLFGNWALEVWEVGSGTWFDLAWTVPFAILAIHASEWQGANDSASRSQAAEVELPLPGLLSFAVISLAVFCLRQHGLASTVIALISFAVLLLRTYMLAQIKRADGRSPNLECDERVLGHVPICAACKRIRDEASGRWDPLEAHFGERYGTRFTHGICDLCAEAWYPKHVDI